MQGQTEAKIAYLKRGDAEALDRIDSVGLAERLSQVKQPWDSTQYTPEICRELARNMLCVVTNVNDYRPQDILQSIPKGLEYTIARSSAGAIRNMMKDRDNWVVAQLP